MSGSATQHVVEAMVGRALVAAIPDLVRVVRGPDDANRIAGAIAAAFAGDRAALDAVMALVELRIAQKPHRPDAG